MQKILGIWPETGVFDNLGQPTFSSCFTSSAAAHNDYNFGMLETPGTLIVVFIQLYYN